MKSVVRTLSMVMLLCAGSGLVMAAQKPPSMWEGFSEQLKTTLPLVLATNTSSIVVQAVLPPITQLLATVVAAASFLVRIGQKGFNRVCNRLVSFLLT